MGWGGVVEWVGGVSRLPCLMPAASPLPTPARFFNFHQLTCTLHTHMKRIQLLPLLLTSKPPATHLIPALFSVPPPYADPRVKRIQQRLGCYTDASTTGNISVFRPACTGKRISLADVTGALRDHYDGTAKDCYRQQTPKAVLKGNANEPWRPIAHLTTGYAHGEQGLRV